MKQKIPINVHTTNHWCIVTKNDRIIERFRLLTTAHQMISFFEKQFFQKLYIKRLKDLNQSKEIKMYEDKFCLK